MCVDAGPSDSQFGGSPETYAGSSAAASIAGASKANVYAGSRNLVTIRLRTFRIPSPYMRTTYEETIADLRAVSSGPLGAIQGLVR